MATVTSADGTIIAFDRVGSGPALILVDGALCHRRFGPSAALAKQLAGRFTVFTYDRRGRGESGNTLPFSPAREVEDLAALIAAAARAFVCGVSSGGALALEAATGAGDHQGGGLRRRSSSMPPGHRSARLPPHLETIATIDAAMRCDGS
jgi:pimeloyl-ACP methyl ester carboxylesterase